MKTNFKQSKGFTLIEIMISVLIIAVLAGITLSMLNNGGFRQKARDSQRVSDLKKIQAALELFYSDNRYYPRDAGWVIADTGANIASATGTTGIRSNYIQTIPVDPSASGTPGDGCALGASDYRYMYKSNALGTRYVLFAHMELATSATPSPCSGLNNLTPSMCAAAPTTPNCYGVQNP